MERSFAHVCETGGARRTWLRGLEKINKRYSMVVAAHNLGLVMRSLFGSGKPRQLAAVSDLLTSLRAIVTAIRRCVQQLFATDDPTGDVVNDRPIIQQSRQKPTFSTAC